MIKNTGSIEAKILIENPKIEPNSKVRFLRRNDEMTRIMNFKAFILEIETWISELKYYLATMCRD